MYNPAFWSGVTSVLGGAATGGSLSLGAIGIGKSDIHWLIAALVVSLMVSPLQWISRKLWER